MSSDEDFDAAAYKTFEDQLYEEQSLSGSDDDLDSEIEEVLYSQVHYASSLLVSENSTPGERTPKTRTLVDNGLDAQGQKCGLDSSVIELSSDGDKEDVENDDYTDNHEDVNFNSSSNYPEVVNIFSDENHSMSSKKTSKESLLAQNKVEPGKTAENWNLNERDLENFKPTKQRPRYYTPGKGLPHVRCYNCNEKGHLSQNCPEPKKVSVCFLCGGVGHVKRFCPNELCFNCYEPGHMFKQCMKPRRRPYDRCNRCHVLGHLANDCPDRWRQYHLTTEVGPVIRPEGTISSPPIVYCYNCGDQGHYGHECREDNATRRDELPLPFVVHYDCQVSPSREKKKYDRHTPMRRSIGEKQHQTFAQGFLDQPRQQDCDIDGRLFQPPPEKIRKIDDGNVRRVSFHNDSYKTSEFNSPNTVHAPKREKKNKNREEIAGRNEECREDNATRRDELPLPFDVHYDGCQVSPSREKRKYDRHTPERRSKGEKQHQTLSQGFRDQPRHQDCDIDGRLFQPPPEKIRKIDDGDVRRVSFHNDSYKASEFNSPNTVHAPKRKKKNKNREEIAGRNGRIVEILDPSPSDNGLIKEPYQFKKKKAKKRGRQHWQEGDSFDDNFDRINFITRNNFKQRNERRFSNPHRKGDFRSFEERQFDSKRTSSNPKKGNKNFVSSRGFQFNNGPRRKKSNPQHLKRYTF